MKYLQSGSLLDLGAGHGRHAIYFAQQGFVVTAAEPVTEYCDEIINKATHANVVVQVIQDDIKSFPVDAKFDAVVCAMVLHFLEYQEAKQAVTKMQNLTNTGGCNVISAYTSKNTGDFMKGNPYGSQKYLLKPGELKEQYKDWEILEYSEAWTPPGIINLGDVPTSYHKVNMIARKP
jgi:tellurite methyltransferase